MLFLMIANIIVPYTGFSLLKVKASGEAPVINYLSLYSKTDHTWLAPIDTISAGKTLRIYFGINDVDTPPGSLTVTISYKPTSGGTWTDNGATYFGTWDYFYIDWAIPIGTTAEAYDVKVTVSDVGGDSATLTTTGAFNIVQTLMMRLPFSDNAIPTSDTSGNGNIATPTNGVAWQSANGGCYHFDGTNDYINVADSTKLDGNDGWTGLTIEFWVKPDLSDNAAKKIMRKGAASPGPFSYQIGFQTSGGKLYFDVWNTPTPGVTGTLYEVEYSTLLSANNWYHIVCTYKSGIGSKIYINGIDISAVFKSGSTTGYVAKSRSQNLYLGCRYGTTDFFTGYLDDVQIYSEALTPSAVWQHYIATNIDH